MKITFKNPSKKVNPKLFNTHINKINEEILLMECPKHFQRTEYILRYKDSPDSFDLDLICCCPEFEETVKEKILSIYS